MCVNCDNGSSGFDDVLGYMDVLAEMRAYMNRAFKTPEQMLQEKNDDLDKARNSVIKSYTITDNVRLHLTGNIPQVDVTNLINWFRRLNAVAPASGNVDIYAPYTPVDAPKNEYGDDLMDAATTKVDANGYITMQGTNADTPHRIIFFTPMMFTRHGSAPASKANPDDPNWSMPVANHVSNLYYTVVHEWAHVIDMRLRDDRNQYKLLMRMQSQGLLNPYGPFSTSLSSYATSSEVEAFAEAFAEWHISKGHTDNFAAKWYAREYGWHQYN